MTVPAKKVMKPYLKTQLNANTEGALAPDWLITRLGSTPRKKQAEVETHVLRNRNYTHVVQLYKLFLSLHFSVWFVNAAMNKNAIHNTSEKIISG